MNNKRFKSTIHGNKNTVRHNQTRPYHIAEVKAGRLLIEDTVLRCVYIRETTVDKDTFKTVDLEDVLVQQSEWIDMSTVVHGLCFDDLIHKVKETPEHWAHRFAYTDNTK